MALVQTQNLKIAYAENVILRDVSLTIHRGEILTLIGPNGSGKSSLVRALMGALAPVSGKIMRADALKIGYVPQRLEIDRTLPISLNRFLNLPKRQPVEKIETAIGRVGVKDILGRQIGALSGGQLQRALLAKAILAEPDLLVLDEPTQGLDQPATAQFYKLLEELRTELDCAILLVSHDLHVVMSASDRVICLNGHVCCEGTPEVVQAAPEYRALFGPGTGGTMALYRHDHDHEHHAGHSHD